MNNFQYVLGNARSVAAPLAALARLALHAYLERERQQRARRRWMNG